MQRVFFTNHMRVLALLAEQPDLRLRQIAGEVGITERAAHRIVSELVDEGYLNRERHGSKSRYTPGRPLSLDRRTAALITGRARSHPGAARLEAIFRAIPGGVAVTDSSGTVVAVNQAYCELLGCTEADLLGRSHTDHMHPDDRSADDDDRQRLLSGAQAELIREKRFVRPDGTTTWITLRSVRTIDSESSERLVVAQATAPGVQRHDQQLAEAEERFRNAFDNAPIGLALVAIDGRFIKVNRALCEITGYSETSLLVRTFQAITDPADLKADLDYVARMLAGEIRTYQMDKRYRHAAGHSIWVSLSVSLVRDPRGEPLYFISQIMDITDRRAAEEAMRRTLDRIAEAVTIIDADGTHLHMNPAARAILTGLRERLGDRAVAEVDWGAVNEDGSPVRADQLPVEITRLTGREIDNSVVGYPSTTGELRWLRVSTRRLTDGLPPYQVISSFTDVTRRKQAERALAVSQSRLRGLFRYIPAALSLRDLDGRYLDVTDSVARAHGRSPEEMVGRHPAEHLPPLTLAETLADDAAMRNEPHQITREISFRHADGNMRDYFVVKWPVLDDNGEVGAFGTFSLDITERKNAEQQVLDLLESAPDAMIIVDGSGTIRIVNAQTERLFGYPRSELIGKDIEILVPERALGRHAAHRTAYAEDPHVRPMGKGLELSGRRRDGSEFPVEISLGPLHTTDGALISAAIRDVSHRRPGS